jgi:hypothetical protein
MLKNDRRRRPSPKALFPQTNKIKYYKKTVWGFWALWSSASAFFLMTTLRNLSRDGPTVIASIHQPSREVFEFPRYTLNNKRLSLQLQKNLFATARDFVCSNHKFCLQQP